MRKATILVTVAVLFLYCADLAFAEAQVGVKTGDWIRCDYVSGGTLPNDAPQWVKVECLSVAGTTATLRITTHFGSGAEQTEIMVWDVASGTGNLTFQALIPANSKTGDTIKVLEDGSVTIAGEKTGTYAGATRTVVYATLTQGDMQFNYCWDKETGVLVEITLIQGSTSATYKATSTNIWQASASNPLTLPSLSIEILSISISIIVAIVMVVTAVIYTKHKSS
ncbi:MAG: hypothetical protein QHH17_08295 [Candidatus Bathyarchaeota archaeon]|nr:hypothetical protein [Candidatus Bathyarchaeota archaeon]